MANAKLGQQLEGKVMGWNGMEWDRIEWDYMGLDEMEQDWMGWKRVEY